MHLRGKSKFGSSEEFSKQLVEGVVRSIPSKSLQKNSYDSFKTGKKMVYFFVLFFFEGVARTTPSTNCFENSSELPNFDFP